MRASDLERARGMARSDRERLELFSERVRHAISRRAVQEGTLRAQFSLTAVAGAGVTLEQDQSDVEDVRSLLLEFRKFLAQKEDVFFSRIANIVERSVGDEELKAANRTNREAWNRAGVGMIAFNLNGRDYRSSDWFDIVVNGGIFHDDQAKSDLYKSLDDMSRALAEQSVNSMVMDCLRVLHAERNLIDAGLGNGSFKLP